MANMKHSVREHIDSLTHGIPGDRKDRPQTAGHRNISVTEREHTGLKGGTTSAQKAGTRSVKVNLGWGQNAEK